MAKKVARVSRLTQEDLASRPHSDLRNLIIEDIRRKGLRDGDRYLGADGVGELLGVSPVTANRLLAAMAEENLVVRRRKAGTFVGSGFVRDEQQRRDGLRVLHILMVKENSHDQNSDERWSEVMWKQVPGAALRIHQVPEDESFFHARHIVGQIAASGLDEGLILIRATERIQRLVAQSGVKAVVFGHLFPGVGGLHCVTMDQTKAGELAVAACRAQKCQQLVVVMRASWRMGDADFFAAILRQAGAAGLRADQIQLVVADEEPDACSDQIRQALASSPSGRIGLICRHSAFARAALRHKGDFHIVSATADNDSKHLKGCDEILATLSREKIGQLLLQQLALPLHESSPAQVIPVRLN
ncbi:MAG: hypothetical protein RL095_1833 [Verrucomicrobiota bacterium]|jgi:DNA-binding transcriptional regulator YhcF (GntR family)